MLENCSELRAWAPGQSRAGVQALRGGDGAAQEGRTLPWAWGQAGPGHLPYLAALAAAAAWAAAMAE